jgi:hypothetical protein
MKLIYTNKKNDASNDGFECVKEGGPGQPPRPRNEEARNKEADVWNQ